MTERERLIEILSTTIYPRIGADPAEVVADFLLDNGVIVPPVKVGDIAKMIITVLYISRLTFRLSTLKYIFLVEGA